jgi:transcription initiation factor TFIIF subunit beta
MPDPKSTTAGAGTIKTEPGVKTELDELPTAALEGEDDLYEDAGDLEFYDRLAHNGAYGSVYLARMPKYLYEAWDTIDDDEEIQIGQMRYWTENNQPRMQLLLDSDRPEHKNMPKEYSLDITAAEVNNTFVFYEQELPEFKAKTRARAEAAAAGIPAALLARREAEREKEGKDDKEGGGGGGGGGGKYGRKQRWQPYFRKAVPSEWDPGLAEEKAAVACGRSPADALTLPQRKRASWARSSTKSQASRSTTRSRP